MSTFRRRSLMFAVALCLPLLGLLAHAATLSLVVSTQITGTYRGSNDLGAPRYDLTASLQPPINLGTGTGDNQVNALFADTRSLSASGTENLDLAGSLVDPLGGTLTFATVKLVKVCAAAANTNNVLVGGAGSNTFLGMFDDATDIVRVKPGGCFVWIAPGAGAAVTASTGDILKVANSTSGSSVTYDIIIAGTQ